MSSVERRRVPAIKILADCSQRWIRAVSGDTGAVRYGTSDKDILRGLAQRGACGLCGAAVQRPQQGRGNEDEYGRDIVEIELSE